MSPPEAARPRDPTLEATMTIAEVMDLTPDEQIAHLARRVARLERTLEQCASRGYVCMEQPVLSGAQTSYTPDDILRSLRRL